MSSIKKTNSQSILCERGLNPIEKKMEDEIAKKKINVINYLKLKKNNNQRIEIKIEI